MDLVGPKAKQEHGRSELRLEEGRGVARMGTECFADTSGAQLRPRRG